ncbi:MAG: LTA synthase family protein [Candidatus Avispirillum sp.]
MWVRIKKTTDKKTLLCFAAAAVIFAVAAALLGVNIFISIAGGILLFAVLTFKIEFADSLPVWIRFIILLLLTLIVFILMQTAISCGIFLISPLKFFMNVIILAGLSSLLWMVTGNIKISITIVTVICYFVAIADHLVVQARSFEIQFSDFSALGTAARVAGGYSFTLSTVTKLGIVLGIVFLTFVMRCRFPSHERSWKRTAFCMGSIVATYLCAVVIYTQFCASFIGYQDKYWMYRGSERNGFLVNIIYSASATRVTEPEDYDAAVLEEELDIYLEAEDDGKGSLVESEKKPNVIVIMNETFSDVHNIAAYMGKEMKTDVPVTPFLDSLSDKEPNIIKGHAIASVYGGNTANSELEFLTGQSIQFIPRNTVAYNLFMTELNSFSVVNNFNNAGYRTVGMHPEQPVNWQRDKIYSYFDFDEVYFMDDFTEGLGEDGWFRDHVSDQAVYDKIIDLYENKEEGDPLFTFAVTMQNHGGYTTAGFDYTVNIEGYENYTGIREYLSCIKNSDEALKNLISYFEAADEETVIVFFGDHQPSLSNIASKFYGLDDSSTVEDQQAKYAVPYLIWANYDIDCDRAASITSINYLSSWLLDIVDSDLTDFQRFIKKVNTEVPMLNSMGWYDNGGVFHDSTYSAPELSESLKLYSRLQYNAMYDNKGRLPDLFGIKARLPKD